MYIPMHLTCQDQWLGFSFLYQDWMTQSIVSLLVLLWLFAAFCTAGDSTLELCNQLSGVSWVKDSLNTPCPASGSAVCSAHDWTHPAAKHGLVSLLPSFFHPGSGTFILLAHLSRIWGGATHVRQKVQTGFVTAWGLRWAKHSAALGCTTPTERWKFLGRTDYTLPIYDVQTFCGKMN